MDRKASVLAVFALLSLVSASTSATSGRARGHLLMRGVRSQAALFVRTSSLPALKVAGYDTRGTYPQIAARDVGLKAVNAALRDAVLRDEEAYGPHARAERRDLGRHHSAVGVWRGRYRTVVAARLVSASSEVVSALLP